MPFIRRPLLLACLLLLPWTVSAAEPAPLHALFIGNSYTYGNELPKLIAVLAQAGEQRPVEYEKQTPGGWTFKKHWEESKAASKIAAKKWNIVVLQDHSLAALNERTNMIEYGKKLHAAVKQQGARPIFFMTWAHQNKPETQADISKAYQELAAELKAEVAPVGLAWQAALQADPKLVLHAADKSHPNLTGSYLAACVFYAVIYDKSPEGLPGKSGGLTDATAAPLQALAWKVVQQQKKTAMKEPAK